MSKERHEIFSNNYMSLFSDGTIGLNDGVGYVDTLNESEVLELYAALKKFVEPAPDGGRDE